MARRRRVSRSLGNPGVLRAIPADARGEIKENPASRGTETRQRFLLEQYWLGASADDAPEVLPAAPPANAFPYRGSPRDSTMKPLPPHVVRALQEQQQ